MAGALQRCRDAAPTSVVAPRASILQRKCACGSHTADGGECAECRKQRDTLRRHVAASSPSKTDTGQVPPLVHEVLRSPGFPLDGATRALFEPRFGHDFSNVRVHTDAQAARSADAVHALAYTVGSRIAFRDGQYAPGTIAGRQLIAHELAHVVQQGLGAQHGNTVVLGPESSPAEANAEATARAVLAGGQGEPLSLRTPVLQRRAAPYIKKVTVHLAPSQSADLEWEGTPPADATGSDHFTVSTGKGYGDADDPPGTCTRQCCSDPMKQCAPPWNRPTEVGSCCTYYGNDFWTGTPLKEHNTWKWWTPIQPYYASRGIALHQHPDVTGEPIGHGCVRMAEPNAKRIYDYSNGRRTNVTIDGRAAPVSCKDARRCAGATGGSKAAEGGGPRAELETVGPVPGLEGVMS